MEYQEQSIEDRSLDERAVSRFNHRMQDQVTRAEWLANVERAHEGIADRRIVEVSGAMASAELEADKYERALKLLERHHFTKRVTIAEWRDGRIGKRTIDNYTRDILESDNSYDARCGAEYTEVCSIIEKLERGDGYDVVITNEPSAFLRLGCQSIDNNSCYRADHECELAPLIIAEQHGSFVGYIKERGENKVLSRCWGIDNTDGEFFFTNVYSRGEMPYTARAIFTAALRVVCNSPDTRVAGLTCIIERPRDVYLNGDMTCNSDRVWSLSTCIRSNELGFCHWCEEHCIESDDDIYFADDVGAVCRCCIENRFVWSEVSDTYIHDENATRLHDGEYCRCDDAVELYDGEYAHDDEGIVLIAHGEHEGAYALENDSDLRYTPCCNEAYIEGSL